MTGKNQYIFEIDPTVPGAVEHWRPFSDRQYRAVASILIQRGYPGGPFQSADDFDWLYESQGELDTETIRQLEEIPGVKVSNF
jgi:hypothetical protein